MVEVGDQGGFRAEQRPDQQAHRGGRGTRGGGERGATAAPVSTPVVVWRKPITVAESRSPVAGRKQNRRSPTRSPES